MTAPSVVVVAETSDELEATLWADALRDEGVRAEVMVVGTRGALGGGVLFPGAWFRLLVDRTQFEAARNVIADHGGAEHLAALPPEHTVDPMRFAWIMAAIIAAFFGLGIVWRLAEG